MQLVFFVLLSLAVFQTCAAVPSLRTWRITGSVCTISGSLFGLYVWRPLPSNVEPVIESRAIFYDNSTLANGEFEQTNGLLDLLFPELFANSTNSTIVIEFPENNDSNIVPRVHHTNDRLVSPQVLFLIFLLGLAACMIVLHVALTQYDVISCASACLRDISFPFTSKLQLSDSETNTLPAFFREYRTLYSPRYRRTLEAKWLRTLRRMRLHNARITYRGAARDFKQEHDYWSSVYARGIQSIRDQFKDYTDLDRQLRAKATSISRTETSLKAKITLLSNLIHDLNSQMQLVTVTLPKASQSLADMQSLISKISKLLRETTDVQANIRIAENSIRTLNDVDSRMQNAELKDKIKRIKQESDHAQKVIYSAESAIVAASRAQRPPSPVIATSDHILNVDLIDTSIPEAVTQRPLLPTPDSGSLPAGPVLSQPGTTSQRPPSPIVDSYSCPTSPVQCPIPTTAQRRPLPVFQPSPCPSSPAPSSTSSVSERPLSPIPAVAPVDSPPNLAAPEFPPPPPLDSQLPPIPPTAEVDAVALPPDGPEDERLTDAAPPAPSFSLSDFSAAHAALGSSFAAQFAAAAAEQQQNDAVVRAATLQRQQVASQYETAMNPQPAPANPKPKPKPKPTPRVYRPAFSKLAPVIPLPISSNSQIPPPPVQAAAVTSVPPAIPAPPITRPPSPRFNKLIHRDGPEMAKKRQAILDFLEGEGPDPRREKKTPVPRLQRPQSQGIPPAASSSADPAPAPASTPWREPVPKLAIVNGRIVVAPTAPSSSTPAPATEEIDDDLLREGSDSKDPDADPDSWTPEQIAALDTIRTNRGIKDTDYYSDSDSSSSASSESSDRYSDVNIHFHSDEEDAVYDDEGEFSDGFDGEPNDYD